MVGSLAFPTWARLRADGLPLDPRLPTLVGTIARSLSISGSLDRQPPVLSRLRLAYARVLTPDPCVGFSSLLLPCVEDTPHCETVSFIKTPCVLHFFCVCAFVTFVRGILGLAKGMGSKRGGTHQHDDASYHDGKPHEMWVSMSICSGTYRSKADAEQNLLQ